MPLDGSEHVLCVPRDIVLGLGPWTGWKDMDDDWLNWLMCGAEARPRTEELEADADWLQLCSYGVVWTAVNNAPPAKMLVYRRPSKGTEGRLHGRLSLGVGGHYEATDSFDGDFWQMDTLEWGMHREIREELHLGLDDVIDVKPIGFLFDSSWIGVESVHFGIAWTAAVSSDLIGRGFDESSIDLQGWWTHREIIAKYRPELFDATVDLEDHPAPNLPPVDQWEKWSEVIIASYLRKPILAKTVPGIERLATTVGRIDRSLPIPD